PFRRIRAPPPARFPIGPRQCPKEFGENLLRKCPLRRVFLRNPPVVPSSGLAWSPVGTPSAPKIQPHKGISRFPECPISEELTDARRFDPFLADSGSVRVWPTARG